MKNVGLHSKNLERYEKNSESSYSSERAVHRRFQNNCFQKRYPDTNVFSVSFAKFLRTPFLKNTSGWLLLTFQVIT